MPSYMPSIELSLALDDSRNLSKIKTIKSIRMAAESLEERYEDVITGPEKCKANALYWYSNSANEYSNKFLVLILMEAYNVWDNSHERYYQILKAIEERTPQWKQRYVNEHERRMKICKVPIYVCECEVVHNA